MLAALNISHQKRLKSGDSGARPAPAATAARPSPGSEQPAASSELAFREAAAIFDPCAITRLQMAAMAALLAARGAISERDHLILETDPTAGRMAVARDLAAPRDAIRDWQERRATDMELGRVRAVEASTRALSILGRVAALRIRRPDNDA